MSRARGDSAWRAADLHQRGLSKEVRKQRGVWFTPPALARPTAARALAPLDDGRPLRICDPAVGGGSFLLAARDALSRSTASLAGVDVDPDALRIARQALPDAQLVEGDGLTALQDESFDAVLTNPPWETLQDGPDAAARAAALRPRFALQGRGKLFTYRLFLERAYQLLKPGGRLGAVVPASLWFDRDAEPLRELLLDRCSWEWLFGFENREGIFDIDSRYRFGVVIATKGGATSRVQVAFGCTGLAAWAGARPAHTRYDRAELQHLSPHAGTFVEVECRRDLEVLTRMHDRGTPLLEAFTWRQGDYNMTADRDHFVQREDAEARGYAPSDDGVWRSRNGPDLLALRQGAMIYDLDANAGAHEAGVGHRTRWRRPTSAAELRPLYLVDAARWQQGAASRAPARVALRALSNATNERTVIACLLPDVPCGNSLGVLTPAREAGDDRPLQALATLAATLGSLPFDWTLRMRLGGTNLNRFVLADCVLPTATADARRELARCALRLCATTRWAAPLWEQARREGWAAAPDPATEPAERRALQTRIDVLVGRAFGLREDDVAWITRGPPFAKGFWRVERDLPESERRPARWRRAAAADPSY